MMKNNNHNVLHPPFDYNPKTKLWGHLASNAIEVVGVSKACEVSHCHGIW
jgi:hypothetical protein